MKIVVVSDSHGRNDILNVIREKHPDAGLFIHCGDLEADPMFYPAISLFVETMIIMVVLKMKELFQLVSIVFMLRIRIASRIFQEANSFQIGQKHWIVILYVLDIRTLPIWIKWME